VLAQADTALLGASENPQPTRRAALEAYLAYADGQVASLDVAEDALFRPMYEGCAEIISFRQRCLDKRREAAHGLHLVQL